MSWCTNFDLKRKDDVITQHRAMACFANFYGSMSTYKEVIVYVLDKYPYPYDANGSNRNYTDEEIKEYTRLLQEIGFNFHLNESLVEITVDKKKIPAYAFSIIPEENSNLVNHFLLALIRFLYESTGTDVVKEFLEMCKQEGKTSTYNRLILAMLKKVSPSGHVPLPYGLPLLVTQEELEKKVLDKSNNHSNVSDSLPQTKGNGEYYPSLVSKLRDRIFTEEIISIDQLEENYRKICEEYM